MRVEVERTAEDDDDDVDDREARLPDSVEHPASAADPTASQRNTVRRSTGTSSITASPRSSHYAPRQFDLPATNPYAPPDPQIWRAIPRWVLGHGRVNDLDPEVAMFDDETIGVETEERHACEILATAADELGPGAPPNRCPIAVDDRSPELAVGRLLFVEDASEIARFGIAERILLPEGVVGVQRIDGVQVVLTPTALPDVSPPLRGLPRMHVPSLSTRRRLSHGYICPGRDDPVADAEMPRHAAEFLNALAHARCYKTICAPEGDPNASC